MVDNWHVMHTPKNEEQEADFQVELKPIKDSKKSKINKDEIQSEIKTEELEVKE